MIRRTFFFAPENASGGGTGTIDAPLGGSAAALLPVGSEGGGGGPGAIDVADYVPPSTSGLDELLQRNDDVNFGEGEGAAPDPAPKTEEKPAAPAKPIDPPKPADRKAEDLQPVAQLREAYNTLKADHERAAQELDALRSNHPEVATLKQQLQEREAKLTELEATRVELNQKLAFHDPAAAREVSELDSKFTAEINGQLQTFPALRPQLQSLVEEYEALPHGKAEYAQAFEAFEQKLGDTFGDAKAQRALTMITQGAKYRADRQELMSSLRANSGEAIFKAQLADWKRGREEFEADAKDFLAMPEGALESDPFNPLVFLQHCKTVDGSKYDETVSKVIERVRLAAVGAQPKYRTDFPGMSEEQIAATLKQEAQAVNANRKLLMRVATQGLMTMAYFRPFMKNYKAMEERLRSLSASAPDPTGGAGGRPDGSGGTSPSVVDVDTYTPPAIPREGEFYTG